MAIAFLGAGLTSPLAWRAPFPSLDGDYFAYFDPVRDGSSYELIISTAQGKIVARYVMDPGLIAWSNADHLMVINRERKQAIVIPNVAGTFVIVATLGLAPGTEPLWAPSGTKLAYVRRLAEGSGIATYDLLQQQAMPVPLPPRSPSSSPILLFWPPGGLELYFLEHEKKEVVLNKLDVVTGAIEELARSSGQWGGAALGLPQISSNGTRIYLPPPVNSVVDAASGEAQWALPAKARALGSAWSADGSLFYYFRADSPAEVYAHDFANQGDRIVVQNAEPSGFFSWDGGSYFFRLRSQPEPVSLTSGFSRWLTARWGWQQVNVNTQIARPLGREDLWPWAVTRQGRILMSRDDYVRVHYGLYDPNGRTFSEYRIPTDSEDLTRQIKSHAVHLLIIALYALVGFIFYLTGSKSAPARTLGVISLILMSLVAGLSFKWLVLPEMHGWSFPMSPEELRDLGGYPLLPRVGMMNDLMILFLVSLALLPPALCHFSVVFPEGNRFCDSHKSSWIPLFVVSFLPAAGLAFALTRHRPPEAVKPLMAGLALIGTGAAIITALLALLYNYRHPPHRRARDQIRWEAMACVFPLTGALAVLTLYALFYSLLGQWPQAWSSPFNAPALGGLLLLTPLTLGYALAAPKLFDIRLLARRMVRTSILIILALETYALGAAGLSWATTGSFRNPPRFAVIVSILLAAAVLALTGRKLRPRIDQTLAPAQYDLRQTLDTFAQGLPEILDRATLVKALAKFVPKALKAQAFYFFTADRTTRKLRFEPDSAKASPTPASIKFDPAEPLCQYLLERHRPFEVEVSPYDPALIPIFRDAAPRLSALKAALVVGLERRGELLGLMVLGVKHADEFYDAEELELLTTVARQAALALEKIAVFEAVAPKRETKGALVAASAGQAPLSPRVLPETAGCQVAGHSIPAQSAGGDYYDLLELPDHKIALAIGRVSGKGASASLGIANLQGLVRAQAPLAEDPATLVRRINRQLYASSPGANYCTLFYAVYDPAERRMELVNAGQNPPLVWGSEGVRFLESRGVPLGLLPEVTPEVRSELLKPGTTVILFSDGVAEARNRTRESYGVDRLIAAITRSLENDAHSLLGKILDDLRQFTGDASLEDDQTLVVMKVAAA